MVTCDFYFKCSSAGKKCNSCQRNKEKDYYIPRPWWDDWYPYYPYTTPTYVPPRRYYYVGDDPNQQDYYITC
jgi:hypothetical protein